MLPPIYGNSHKDACTPLMEMNFLKELLHAALIEKVKFFTFFLSKIVNFLN